ncbi:MAG: IS1182 family transposase [Methylotenera sp.]|uniref:IS1182 family transposase n=1 Tax=Methylotenera sp. TaxID=2051956 RepID=UPI0027255228|nr:IS1182 family transposase [Methylotenera sp.]MDO9150486.1 IS1182 family transposase [Methylotenera sp.]
MSAPFKSSPVEFNQHQLFPSNIFDLLPEGHECYLYADLFQQLDTTTIESGYSIKGQNAYHPKQIVSILIYAYSRGVFSSRQIERRCREDLSFMFIAQMNCPNFRVLSDFRKDHGDFFQACFKQTVKLALALKLASLGHISLDGSKFKANSSKHKAMSYGRLKEKEQALSAEIDALIEQANRCGQEEDQAYKERTGYELPEDLKHKQGRLAKIKAAKKALEHREEQLNPGQNIEDKKQISFADTEARIMGKNGNFDYAYNAQISVDADLQIIVGQHVSQNANDKQEIEPALKALQDTAGRLPEQLSADNGYLSGDNLQALEHSRTDAYIATDKGEKSHKTPLDSSDRKLVKADFEYHEADNTFICPKGQVLKLKRQGQDGSRVYQGSSEVCTGCLLQSRCCQSAKGEARTINTDDKEPLRQQMNSKMATESAKAVYRKRKTIVEPVFGHIKNSGFRGFSVRGKEKVAGEFSLVCATHNIKKIAKAIFTGVVRPEWSHLTTKPAI